MEKINLIEVRGRLGLGATEKNMQLISKYLDRSIFNVLACVSVPGGERENAFRKMRIKICNIKSHENLFKLIKDKNIHVVHFHASEKHYQTFIKAAREAGALAIILMDNTGKMVNSKIYRLIVPVSSESEGEALISHIYRSHQIRGILRRRLVQRPKNQVQTMNNRCAE